MYAPIIVEQRLEIAQRELGFLPQYHSVAEVQDFNERLERKYADAYARAEALASGSQDAARIFQTSLLRELNNPESPRLSKNELRWMLNENALVQCDCAYWLTRYYYIKTPTKVQRFTFLPGQKIYFDVVALLEERRAPIELIIVKARQHGISTQTEGFIMHAGSFTYGMNGIIASANKDMTAKMSQMTFLGYDMMPWWMKPVYTRRVESNSGMIVFGGLKSGISFQHGNQMSAIARGDTILKYHLSEVASYAKPEALIEAGLFKCVHAHPNVFGVLESTAEGDKGWWPDTYWHAKAHWKNGKSRLCPLFLPWHLATDKYPNETWIRVHPVPRNWRPVDETSAMMARAKLYIQSNPVLEKVLGSGWSLPLEQAWFWEMNFLEHRAKGQERLWFQEMPTDDRESFQGSYNNVFGREVIAEVFTKREQNYWVYGIVGQSIEESKEPDAGEIDYGLDRIRVTFKSGKGDTYGWELVPLLWNEKEAFSSVEEVMNKSWHQGKLFVFEHPRPVFEYCVAVDTSGGTGGDDTCIAVSRLARNFGEPDVQVAEFRSNTIGHVEAWAWVLAICAYFGKYMADSTRYGQPLCVIEQVASVGDTCQKQMKLMGYSRFHNMIRYDSKKLNKSKSTKQGWFSYSYTRDMLTGMFVTSVQNGWYIVNSPWTIWEMDHWEIHLTASGKEKKEHSSDATDDGIFANAMATFCPNDLKNLAERTKKRPEQLPENLWVDFSPYEGHRVSTRAWMPDPREWRVQ